MSNSFETAHGLDRDSPKDAVLDKDGDGADNLSEGIAGTDPTDPTDLATWTSHSIHVGTGTEISASLNKATIDADDGVPGNLPNMFAKVAVAKP